MIYSNISRLIFLVKFPIQSDNVCLQLPTGSEFPIDIPQTQ